MSAEAQPYRAIFSARLRLLSANRAAHDVAIEPKFKVSAQHGRIVALDDPKAFQVRRSRLRGDRASQQRIA